MKTCVQCRVVHSKKVSIEQRLADEIDDLLPAYLKQWAQEKIDQDAAQPLDVDDEGKPLRERSVNSMAKRFRKTQQLVHHCLTCGQTFKNAEEVRKHFRHCVTCDKTFKNLKEARAHEQLAQHCRYCGEQFESIEEHCEHFYGQKRLKKEVRRVKVQINLVAKQDFPSEASVEQLLLLRVGMALKVATLVRVGHRSEEFNESIFKIAQGI